MEYTVVIRKAPDGFYIASCPLIPEALAQGETYQKCLANIKEVLELCLEYRKERGEEVPLEIDTQKVTISPMTQSEPFAPRLSVCLRCGHKWWSRIPGKPALCPNCRSPRWDTPRRTTKAQQKGGQHGNLSTLR